MSSEAQLTTTPITAYHSRRALSPRLLKILIVALALFIPGSAVAYLVVIGYWHIAAAVVLIIPATLILHRYPHLAVVIWLLISPFNVQTHTTIARQIYWIVHRGLPPLVLVIILVSAMLRINKREVPRLGVPEIAIAVYILISIFSIFTQNNTPGTTLITFYDQVFIPFCLYAIVRITSVGMRLMKWLIPIAIFIAITQVTFGWLSWFIPHMLPSAWLDYAGARTVGSLSSPGVYTTTLAFSGIIVLHTAMNMRRGWKQLFLIGVFIATLYGIFISYSRASWLMALLVILGLFLIYPRLLIRMTLIGVPLILIAGTTFLSSQLTFAQQRLSSEESDQSALSRLPVMVAAYRMFEEKPVLGWGYNNFDRFDRRFQGRFAELVNPNQKDLTSHNIYMTLLAEQGIVGLALFVLPTFWLFGRSIKKYRLLPKDGWMSQKTLWLLWLVILSYIVVDNFSPMVVVFGLALNWMTLGLIAAIVYSRKVEL